MKNTKRHAEQNDLVLKIKDWVFEKIEAFP